MNFKNQTFSNLYSMSTTVTMWHFGSAWKPLSRHPRTQAGTVGREPATHLLSKLELNQDLSTPCRVTKLNTVFLSYSP